MITLQNMIFANPIAYQIFPNMVNTYNTSTTTEYAVYSGYLNLYKDNELVKQFTGTSTIDLSDVSGRIRFDNVTGTYSTVVGEWDLAKSQDQTEVIVHEETLIRKRNSMGLTTLPSEGTGIIEWTYPTYDYNSSELDTLLSSDKWLTKDDNI